MFSMNKSFNLPNTLPRVSPNLNRIEKLSDSLPVSLRNVFKFLLLTAIFSGSNLACNSPMPISSDGLNNRGSKIGVELYVNQQQGLRRGFVEFGEREDADNVIAAVAFDGEKDMYRLPKVILPFGLKGELLPGEPLYVTVMNDPLELYPSDVPPEAQVELLLELETPQPIIESPNKPRNFIAAIKARIAGLKLGKRTLMGHVSAGKLLCTEPPDDHATDGEPHSHIIGATKSGFEFVKEFADLNRELQGNCDPAN